MSRRRRAEKRTVLPDPKYNDVVAAKFINALMRGGKKSTAESILYKALDSIEQRRGYSDSKRVFHDAIERVSPHLEVRSRRIGGATYQIPVEVRSERSQALAIRWLIETARKRNEPTMSQRLSRELVDAASGQGGAVKKRDDTHKMAEANRAFSHYRW